MKKAVLTAVALATVLASPALAASARHNARAVVYGNAYDAYASAGQAVYDPHAVVIGNRIVGRDPDANVRLDLSRDPISDQ